MTEDQLHRAAAVGDVQWHRLSHEPDSKLAHVAAHLRAIEEEAQKAANVVLQQAHMTDWSITLSVHTTRAR